MSESDFDFEAKAPEPKRYTPPHNERKSSVKVNRYDDTEILNRLEELEDKVVELDYIKKSIELAKTAWLGFRKSVRKVCDPAHKDRVTTLSVLDSFFEVDENERIKSGG